MNKSILTLNESCWSLLLKKPARLKMSSKKCCTIVENNWSKLSKVAKSHAEKWAHKNPDLPV